MRLLRRGATSTTLAVSDPGALSRLLTGLLAVALVASAVALGTGRTARAGEEERLPPPTVAGWVRELTRSFAATIAELPHAADPQTRERPTPRPRSGAFRMNLYRQGDFVHQWTKYWCVAASVQTMINIMEPGRADRSRSFQRRLHFQARRLDQEDDGYWRRLAGEERWRKGLHGLGITDWAELLNVRGYGPYRLARAESREVAIRKAARAIRLTGRPAGLVVWRGAHAWVMSGFKATADPASSDDFRVQEVFIQDPWYPSVSSIWGASRPPDAVVPVAALAEDYLRYDRPGRRHPWRDGRFVLVLPEASG